MRNAKTNNLPGDPREITARFDGICAETGAPIRRGERCIYYPKGSGGKNIYSIKSRQASEFYGWLEDLSMGWDY